METKTNKQTSRTKWSVGDYSCSIYIELEGDTPQEDIINQALFTIKGLGYGGSNEDELE